MLNSWEGMEDMNFEENNNLDQLGSPQVYFGVMEGPTGFLDSHDSLPSEEELTHAELEEMMIYPSKTQ